jgi:hypothetical protein
MPRKGARRGETETEAGGVATPAPDPMTVAREAARGLGRVARMAEEEHRRQPPPEPPREDLPPGAEDFYAELDALQAHVQQLEGGAGQVRMDVYLTHPLPPGFKARMHCFTIEGFGAIDNLNAELVRQHQAQGRWGPLQLFLASKARDDNGIWRYVPGASSTVSVFVPKTEAAVAAAAAAVGTPAPGVPMDPIAAAEKMLEAGRRLTPEKSQTEAIGPLITSVAGAFEKLASASSGPTSEVWKAVIPTIGPLLTRLLTPPPPPKDDFLEKLVLLRESGLLRSGGGGSSMQDTLAIMKFAAETFGGAGGESGWSDKIFSFLDRHAETALARGKDLIDLARVRAQNRPPAPAPPRAMPAGGDHPASIPPELQQLQQEINVAAARHDTGFFPTLRDRIVQIFPTGGAELLEAVSINEGADDIGLGRLKEAGVNLTPQVQSYLKTFCNWLRWVRREEQRRAAAPAPSSPPAAATPVRARCGKCGTTYQLDDEQQWADDSKVCDSPGCGGALERLP